MEHAQAYERWLQTVFPAMLADQCISVFRDMNKKAKKKYKAAVEEKIADKVFERPLWIPDLWKPNKTLTKQWGCVVKPYFGRCQIPRNIRCGEPFNAIIDREAPQAIGAKNAKDMLFILLEKCVPCARKIFQGNNCLQKLLHNNGYVIEKVFVYAIISLGKWLGQEWFTYGIFGDWPPIAPENLLTAASDVIPRGAPAPSSGLLDGASASSSTSISVPSSLCAGSQPSP